MSTSPSPMSPLDSLLTARSLILHRYHEQFSWDRYQELTEELELGLVPVDEMRTAFRDTFGEFSNQDATGRKQKRARQVNRQTPEEVEQQRQQVKEDVQFAYDVAIIGGKSELVTKDYQALRAALDESGGRKLPPLSLINQVLGSWNHAMREIGAPVWDSKARSKARINAKRHSSVEL